MTIWNRRPFADTLIALRTPSRSQASSRSLTSCLRNVASFRRTSSDGRRLEHDPALRSQVEAWRAEEGGRLRDLLDALAAGDGAGPDRAALDLRDVLRGEAQASLELALLEALAPASGRHELAELGRTEGER